MNSLLLIIFDRLSESDMWPHNFVSARSWYRQNNHDVCFEMCFHFRTACSPLYFSFGRLHLKINSSTLLLFYCSRVNLTCSWAPVLVELTVFINCSLISYNFIKLKVEDHRQSKTEKAVDRIKLIFFDK